MGVARLPGSRPPTVMRRAIAWASNVRRWRLPDQQAAGEQQPLPPIIDPSNRRSMESWRGRQQAMDGSPRVSILLFC
jgi:hypothetical protein